MGSRSGTVTTKHTSTKRKESRTRTQRTNYNEQTKMPSGSSTNLSGRTHREPPSIPSKLPTLKTRQTRQGDNYARTMENVEQVYTSSSTVVGVQHNTFEQGPPRIHNMVPEKTKQQLMMMKSSKTQLLSPSKMGKLGKMIETAPHRVESMGKIDVLARPCGTPQDDEYDEAI